jgi:hypothetical protein
MGQLEEFCHCCFIFSEAHALLPLDRCLIDSLPLVFYCDKRSVQAFEIHEINTSILRQGQFRMTPPHGILL